MKLFAPIRKWFSKFFKKRKIRVVEGDFPKIIPNEIEQQTSKQTGEVIVSERKEVKENKALLLIPREIFQTQKIDFNAYKPFFPNWGDLDPTTSTISDGRIRKEFINYLYDDFSMRYGSLTTDLGYGLIYSIVMNAVENENRSVSSALREAIVRSNDPLLCVAVTKDFCERKNIQFDKYERITLEILKKREAHYNSKDQTFSHGSSIDFKSLPPLPEEEMQELNKSLWLFNGIIVKMEPLYLIVKIPTLNESKLIRDFNKDRHLKLNQNIVVQWEGGHDYRVLDFSH